MPDGAHDCPTPSEPSTPHEGSLRRALGAHYGALVALVIAAREVVPVALESVIGQGAELAASTAGLTDFDSLAAEFATIDHLGFELRVAFDETELLPAGLLLPIESAGALLGIDLASTTTHGAGVDTMRATRLFDRLPEFLDLLSLTLFTDRLMGTQVTLADLRSGRAAGALGLVQELAKDATPARVDLVVRLASGVTAAVTLILPLSLLARLAGSPPRATGDLVDATAGPARPLGILTDGSLRVSVELGGSSMTVEELLELGPGSVVELNQLAAEPLDILVNDRLIARGEVLVVDEKFGVRITEISSPRQRANAIER